MLLNVTSAQLDIMPHFQPLASLPAVRQHAQIITSSSHLLPHARNAKTCVSHVPQQVIAKNA